MWLAAAAVLTVLILGLAFLNFQKYDIFSGDSETANSSPDTAAAGADEVASPETDSVTAADDGFPDSSELQAATSAGGGPWVVGFQKDFQYRLSGAVPSEEAKAAITNAVVLTYSDNPILVKNELTVDPSLTAATWLGAVPTYLQVMPLELIEGSVAINTEKTAVAGTAPADQFIENMRTKAGEGNLPPFESTVTIGEGRPPTIIVSAKDDKLTLVGKVPDQRLIDVIETDSIALWGDGNVTNNLEVDEATFARFPVIRFAERQMATYQPLGDFDMRLEQGQLSATVDGGVLFAPGSAEITPEVQKLLMRFPGFFNQVARPVLIFGHTDDTGNAADNQVLSQQRADAAKAFFVENGVAAERITAEGKGQTDPLADNTTEEGRAKNRRVEITLGNT